MIKRVIILVLFALLTIIGIPVGASQQSAKVGLQEIAYSYLMDITPSKFDTETFAERSERMKQVSYDLAKASNSLSDLAVLLTLGREESHFAEYVQNGCLEIPQRAPNCDKGKARSFFQMWKPACRKGWELPRGDSKATAVFADCAIRMWKGAAYRCKDKNPHGIEAAGFSGYAGLNCNKKSSQARAEKLKKLYNKLWQIKYTLNVNKKSKKES